MRNISKTIFIPLILCFLLFSLPHNVRAQGITVSNALPKGMVWRSGGIQISLDQWNTRPGSPLLCGRDVVTRECDIVRSSDGTGRETNCHNVTTPQPTCANNSKIPEAKRTGAVCSPVRFRTSETDGIDNAVCTACAGATCEIFFYNGSIAVSNSNPTSKPKQPTTPTVPTGTTPAPVTGTGQPDSTTQGNGNSTGAGGVGNGTCDPAKEDCFGKGNAPKLVNLLNVSTLPEFIALILGLLVQIGSILLVLALVWTGFLFIQAQGKEESLRSARSALMWTVIGGLLLLGAEALSLLISSTIQSL